MIFLVHSAVNDEDRAAEVPKVFTLHQNAPNPFNPATTVSFRLFTPSTIRFAVYDMLGRETAILAEGEYSAGFFAVRWDGRDRNRVPVSSGVYFYRLEAGGQTETRKMILVR